MKKLTLILIMVAIGSMIHSSLPADTIGSARISLMEGDVLLQNQDTGTEWIAASVNVPLLSGDRIWVPENGRSEIQFLGGSYIRAANKTALDITKLERDSTGNITQVALSQGRAYIHYNGSSAKNPVFQVDTPLVSAMAYGSALFDVYVYEDGYTEVSVIKGTVYVEGQHGYTKVGAGDMISVGTDRYAELSSRRASDGWLSWNVSRDSLAARAGTSVRYLPPALYDYSADFDQYGYWVHTREYGYVWSPRITVSTWAPYRDGRWVWRNHDYVWVSYEPWGWAPYHYGRWGFTVGIGWFWVPPAVNDVFWGPGFVAWINTPTYVSWVPLAPREIYYGYGHYGRHSVNITKVNIKNIHVTNVYVNTRVAHAVTLVHHDTFVRGKHTVVRNAPANPFLAGLRVSTGRPSLKQANYSPLPSKVVHQRYLPTKAVLDTKRTRELRNRNIAVKGNTSAFERTKSATPMRLKVTKDNKSISSNQSLHRAQPKPTPQVNRQVQRQEPRITPPSTNTSRHVEPRPTPQLDRKVQRQEPRAAFAQDNTQSRRQESEPASPPGRDERHRQKKEKKQ